MGTRILAGAFALPAFLLIGHAAEAPKPPLGMPPILWPKDNPYSAAKAELGRYLYFDRRLSADETLSCASCYAPQLGFTDGRAVSLGIKAQRAIANPLEMEMTHEGVVERIRGVAGYRPLFAKAFGSEEIDMDRMAKA